jgi:S-DNA-T family DNA segregation ATPase FtsK/SpoIIIE
MTGKVTQTSAESQQESQVNKASEVLTRFQRFIWDIAGILTLALAVMTLLALLLPGLTQGVLLTWWADLLWIWFGWGSLWIVLLIGIAGLLMLRFRVLSNGTSFYQNVRWSRIFALEVAAFSSLALLAALGGTSFERGDLGLDGGRIGWSLSYLIGLALAPLGMSGMMWRIIALGGVLLVCMIVALRLTVPLSGWAEKQFEASAKGGKKGLGSEDAVSVAPIQGQEASAISIEKRKKRPYIPSEFRKKFRVQSDEGSEKEEKPPPRDDRLPPLDLLVDEKVARPDERNINMTAGLIEKTLAEFGIPAKVVGFRMGPTVTQFAVEPGFVEKPGGNSESEGNRQKIRVSQISALSRDLALSLSAERLRIEAPVPGRPYVGIEVPNSRSTVVRLRPILETEAFYKIGSPLAVALGRDVSGNPVVADLGRMPHLLIAGTTGSGKSVCIAALTTCLVMNNSPEDLRLVMIDPKMVELVRFNGLTHLYGKVETDLERILGVLRWTVAEMDRRYRLLEKSRSRNLDTYNRKMRRRKGGEPLPRIVVLLDELADLMMSAPEQTEPALVRLAQMARATGIHLVVATQRPSTDVVTGLIKANFPARVSFAVASSVDSRVILDGAGAESLLGHGDMLFLPPEASAPIRSQGVMVSDSEVERVITYLQKTYSSPEDESPPWEEMLIQEAELADRDDLVEQAIEIVTQTQRASASLLQRRLRIGYPRAARLIDELEEMGIVGPSKGGGREREVLVDKQEDEV